MTSLARAREPLAPARAARSSAHVTRECVVVRGLPAEIGVVDVEVEGVDGERAVERRQLVEGAVEQVVVVDVGDGDVRVVREVELSSRGPRRQSLASCSVGEMPSTRFTNTTGDTGRNVPEPRRWMPYAAVVAATSSRCRSTCPSSCWSTSTGGTSVMWVGIVAPCSSPFATRNSWRRLPHGSGTARETPIVCTMTPSDPALARRTRPAGRRRGAWPRRWPTPAPCPTRGSGAGAAGPPGAPGCGRGTASRTRPPPRRGPS